MPAGQKKTMVKDACLFVRHFGRWGEFQSVFIMKLGRRSNSEGRFWCFNITCGLFFASNPLHDRNRQTINE